MCKSNSKEYIQTYEYAINKLFVNNKGTLSKLVYKTKLHKKALHATTKKILIYTQ